MSLAIIIAVAVAAPAPAAVTRYDPAFFAASQPNTAFDMVNHLPGFAFDRGDQVRGFVGSAGNVLIDGARPAAKDDSLEDILKRIPVSQVLRIEVIRGGAPGIDMQGKTVLANVVRRKDSGLKGVINASTTRWYDGRLGWGVRAEVSKRAGETSFEGSISAGRGIDDSSGDGPRTITGAGEPSQAYQEHSVGDGFEYKATGAVETPLWGGKVRVHASVTSSPYSYLQNDSPTDPPGQDEIEQDHQAQKTAEIGLRYDRDFGARLKLESVVLQQLGRSTYTDNYSAPDDVEFFSLGKTSGETILRNTVTWTPTPALSLQTGGEGDFNWLKDRTVYLVNTVPQVVPAANVDVNELRGEAFAIATWQARRTLSLEAGLRVEASRIGSTGDVVSARTLVYPKPRAVLTWSPDAADQVRLRLEREVGQLDFDDFAAGAASLSNGPVRAGNPILDPQQDWVAEAAFERRFWSAGDATLTVRHYELRSVIDRVPIYDPAGDYDAPGNIGGGTRNDVAFAVTLPTDGLGLARGLLTGQSTWRWSTVTDPTTGAKRPISGFHSLDAEAHFTQAIPALKSKWGFDLFGPIRETYYRYDEIDTDRYRTGLSLFTEFQPRPDLALRIELENADDRGVQHVRLIYNNLRSLAPPDEIDLRDLHTGRGVYFRLRKTLG